MSKPKRDSDLLAELARSQTSAVDDPELRDCWEIVATAIAKRWILPEGRGSLQEAIDQLENGSGMGVEEYSIDVDEEDDSKVEAFFVNVTHRCPRDAMLRELRRLERRRRGEPEPPDEPPAAAGEQRQATDPPPDVPDADALRRMFQLLAGAQDDEPETEEGDRIRAEVRDQLAAFARSPDALDSDELRDAVEAIGPQERMHMADALRAFAAWTERPEHGGEAVDDAIRALEATIGRLARGGRAQERETQERISRSAQDAIARRLREAGLS